MAGTRVFFLTPKVLVKFNWSHSPPQRMRQIRMEWVKLVIYDQFSCPTVTSYRRKFVFIRRDVRRRRHGALAERYCSVVNNVRRPSLFITLTIQPCTVTRDVVSSVCNNQLLVTCSELAGSRVKSVRWRKWSRR